MVVMGSEPSGDGSWNQPSGPSSAFILGLGRPAELSGDNGDHESLWQAEETSLGELGWGIYRSWLQYPK